MQAVVCPRMRPGVDVHIPAEFFFGTVTTIREALGAVTTYVQGPSSAHAEIYKRFGQPTRLVTCANHGNNGIGSRISRQLMT